MMRRKHPTLAAALLTVALVAILAAALMVAGCGSPEPVTATSEEATTTSEAATTTSAPVDRLDKLTLVAPPGPMAIPMAYIALNDRLADVAEKTEVVIWENADQLKAYVAGKQGDFVTMPSNNSAIFYNRGLEVRLLDVSVWNITYLISTDDKASSFADIKGKSLAVSLRGSVPDLMFQYIAQAEGLDPLQDFEVRYATDPTQAAQLLLSGQVENAVLSEALATAVTLQTKDGPRPLHRALAFDKAWNVASGGDSPIAGTVAVGSVIERPDVIAALLREYQAAVAWMLDNPEEAGRLVETRLPQLGLKAAVMTASLEKITWRFTPATEARPSLDSFYQSLSELSAEVIGGTVPDDGFYFDQNR